jgi:hypothetical protein
LKKFFALFIPLIFLFSLGFSQASVQDIIITPTQLSTLTIKLWTNRAVGATYYPGENIYLYFKTSQDAYITIYDYTTDGKLRMIFPNSFQQNNFVRANNVYVIPNPNYNFVISGPNGREVIEAIASTSPGVIPQPRIGNQPFSEIPEGLGYLQNLKIDIVGKPVAVATTYFYVGYVPRVGIVHFDSQPPKASLYVDGIYEGQTPMDLQLQDGDHLAVFWYGTYNVSKVFKVTTNTYQTVSSVIPVLPNYPSIQMFPVDFNTSPSGAMIFVNGKMLGISPCTVNLDGGTYEITIVKPDYATIVTQISVNNTQSFNFQIQRLSF